MSAYHCLAPTQNAVILNLKLQPISEADQNFAGIRNGIAPARMPVFYREGKYYLNSTKNKVDFQRYHSGVTSDNCGLFMVGALASDTSVNETTAVKAAIIVSGVAEITSTHMAFLSAIKDSRLINLNVLGRSTTSATLQLDLRRLTTGQPQYGKHNNKKMTCKTGSNTVQIDDGNVARDIDVGSKIYIDAKTKPSKGFGGMTVDQLHGEHTITYKGGNKIGWLRPDGKAAASNSEGGTDMCIYKVQDGKSNQAQKVSTAGGFGGAPAPLAPATSPMKSLKKKKRKAMLPP